MFLKWIPNYFQENANTQPYNRLRSKLLQGTLRLTYTTLIKFLLSIRIRLFVIQSTCPLLPLHLQVALRNLCVNDTNHYYLDDASYKCFLEALRPVIGAQSAVDCALSAPTIYDHLRSLHSFRAKLLRRKDEIRKHDQNDYASTGGDAKRLAALGKCLETVKAMEIIPDTPSQPVEDPISKGDQIGLVYALVNVPHAEELLTGVLSNWATRPISGSDERACLEYLWHNFDTLSETVQAVLWDNFVFIVEKMIIGYCTDVLRSDCQTLLTFRAKDRKLRSCVRSVIYTLFVYSGCNKKIFEILNMFE